MPADVNDAAPVEVERDLTSTLATASLLAVNMTGCASANVDLTTATPITPESNAVVAPARRLRSPTFSLDQCTCSVRHGNMTLADDDSP